VDVKAQFLAYNTADTMWESFSFDYDEIISTAGEFTTRAFKMAT
jgi:hypothetical protein